MSALYSLGSIASLPFVPFVSDRLGRRMAILVGSIIMIIGAILQMAAQDCKPIHPLSCMFYVQTIVYIVAMFVIARFLLGFGIPFAIVAASSMIGELSYPKERARIGSLFNASWFIGAPNRDPQTYLDYNMLHRRNRGRRCYARYIRYEVDLGMAYPVLPTDRA